MNINEVYNILSNIKLVLLQDIEESKLEKFYGDLNILHKKLKEIKNNTILINAFIDKYNDELRKIKNFLLQRKDVRSRQIHDKIFTSILKLDKYISLGITQVFEDFVKGITYFSNELENKKKIPIYHRCASCGNSSEDFRKKFLQCYKNNDELTLKSKRDHIFKCYLERLIYDKIYLDSILHFPTSLNNELKQNKGHVFQLIERAKNFNECFLGLKLEIEILYELGLPCYLTIQYIKDGNLIKIEEYSKIVYIDSFGVKRYSDKTILKIIDKDGTSKNIGQFFEVDRNI
jgi:hypothetical protein